MKRRKVCFEIGSERVVVQLLWDEAPTICRKIWESLPIESTATMAKICNHEFMIQLPFDAPLENVQESVPGSVGWWPVRQNINIWFGDPGPTGPLGPTALFGQVIENMQGLYSEGVRTWAKPGTRVRITRYAGEEGS